MRKAMPCHKLTDQSDMRFGRGLGGTSAMTKAGAFIVIALLFSVVAVFPGCASEQTKTTQSTTTANTLAQPQATSTTTASTPAQPQTTTTTETTKTERPDSVLGATAHAVATVILFPFRLIGDAVGLIV
jgi:hypothetical protein